MLFLQRRHWATCCESSLNINGMRTFLVNFHDRPSINRGDHFFANNLLIIEFKGNLVNQKIFPVYFLWNSLFLQFF